ncbi:glycosyltransferase family 4 protein [Clostridium gasigenes]|uniref:Glycosyl transferases group 1 n=1 Tax=Clostridium gasigenes TaxID=94869 RepID=A0A1H0PPV8_9CLOT|nr:glycosyltransferase family 4 protein [Clostridium gasigenes]SDP06685.1 Glycosyl transferases group 1 [Clostridium gasigenes]
MKKKVLFINTRLIYPVNGGRKVVLYNYCKGLNEKFNCAIDILTFLDSGDRQHLDNQPEFINLKGVLKTPSLLEKIYNVLINSIIRRKWPIQVSLYYSRNAQKQVNKYIEENTPDIIICDMARMAEYVVNCKENSFKKILDMDDLLSKRYKRQLGSEELGGEAIGEYINKIPKRFRGILNVNIFMKKILNLECGLLEKYEIRLKNYFDKYIFVSPIEAEEYNKLCCFDKADYVTIGVDYEYYSKELNNEKKKEIIYLGNMNISHNKKAVEFFINNVLEDIINKDNEIIFKIVGKCDDQNYMNKIMANRNVIMTGEVDDIRVHVQQGLVSVAYLTYGSGIKTKILETLAMGVPVITNSIGAEGIKIDTKSGLIVENEISKIANIVLNLIEDKELNNELSIKGKKFISENYRWSNTLERFSNII